MEPVLRQSRSRATAYSANPDLFELPEGRGPAVSCSIEAGARRRRDQRFASNDGRATLDVNARRPVARLDRQAEQRMWAQPWLPAAKPRSRTLLHGLHRPLAPD